MVQTELEPIQDGCIHLRGRYKLQPSRKSPFPEKRFIRYECDKGHTIDSSNEEEVQKCFAQRVGCWKESVE